MLNEASLFTIEVHKPDFNVFRYLLCFFFHLKYRIYQHDKSEYLYSSFIFHFFNNVDNLHKAIVYQYKLE